ncbi:MAG TPA: hypothetical protein VKQ72_19210, partial [Aggregatilineales bacterium]|nr:hypothetical protein [Aggregatilineales bacterium]
SLYPILLHRYAAFSPAPSVEDLQAWAVANHLPGMTLTTVGELLPRWRTAHFTDEELARVKASPLDNLPSGARVLNSNQGASTYEVRLESPIAFRAALHLMYFPGWVGTVNGQPRALQAADQTGYTLIDVPSGTSTIALRYDGTPAMNIGDLLTVVALVALPLVAVLWHRRNPEIAVSQTIVYPQPSLWLLVGFAALLVLKAAWIDSHTTLLRSASTCDSVQGATVQIHVLFGDHIQLCAYALSSAIISPGQHLRLTLYWQIDQPIENLSTYVHMLGQSFNPSTGNPLWGQQDKQSPGTLASSQWLPGKLYQDSYDFPVDAAAPPGNYQLEIGWTQGASERLQPTLLANQDGISVSDLKSLLISAITIR